MFTDNEIELLMDALDALQSKQSSDLLLSTMLGIGLSSSKEDAEEYSAKMVQEMQEAEISGKQLKNRIILLKAKLIQIQDAMTVEDMKRILEG